MTKLIVGCLIVMLSAGASGPAAAAGQLGGIKKAGEAVTDGAKEVGKKTVDTAEKGGKAAKKTVTGDAHATCVDGTRQAGKTEAAAASACAKHGGVAKK